MKKIIWVLLLNLIFINISSGTISSYGWIINKTNSSISYKITESTGAIKYLGYFVYSDGEWIKSNYVFSCCSRNLECAQYIIYPGGLIGGCCSCLSSPGIYYLDDVDTTISLIVDPNFMVIMNNMYPDGIYDTDSEVEFLEMLDWSSSEKVPADEPYKNAVNNTLKADPVHLSNGEFEMNITDLVIGGKIMPVGITRTYGSRREYNSQIGYGWDMNYNMKVRKLAPLAGEPNTVVLLNGGGYKRDYIQDNNAPNLYVNADDLNNYLYLENGLLKLIEKSGIEYGFNVNGCLSTITDEIDNQITITYKKDGLGLAEELKPVYGKSDFFYPDANGQKYGMVAIEYQIDKITDDLGREISFAYDSNGLLETITDFADRRWTYTHDSQTNDLRFVEDPNGRVTEYIYDLRHNLEQIKDPNGNIYITNYYNIITDKVLQQVYGDGTFVFDYNSTDNVGVLTDRQGYKTEIIYTDSGQIKTETIFTLDPDAEPNAFITDYFYNANNQVTRQIFPDGNSIDYKYNSNGNLTGIYQKSDMDDPNDPNDPNVIGTEYTYDPNWPNKIKTVRDPMGNVTEYDYDSNGNLRQITYPQIQTNLGLQTPIAQFSYNGFGQLETSTSVDGIITRYFYYTNPADVNNYGHLWKKVADFNESDPQALNITTEYKYDLVGNIIEMTDPNGDITKFKYNEIDLLKEITNPLNEKTTYTYTPNNKVNTISISSAIGTQETGYGYDALDNLKTITNPLGYVTLYGYNKNEDPNIVTDAEENSTISEFNERGLLWKVTDANGNITEYGYDENGRLKTIQDPNSNTTIYNYDRFGRLKEIIYPDNSNEQFGYDKNSNLLSKTSRAGQTISYEYDALGRLKTISRPDDPNIVYTYDIAGRIDNVNDMGDITYYSYDRIGRLEDVNNPQNRHVGYEYDQLSRRQKLTWPDGSFVTYQYDTLSRLDKIIDDNNNIIADYDYDQLGRRMLLTLGNDSNAVYDYDLGDRLTKLTNNLDGTSLVYSYDNYDKVGNCLSLGINDSNSFVFGYDEIYRLIFVDYNDGLNWSDFYYDRLGNRQEVADSGASTYYLSNSLNQYTSVGGIAYTYDDNGNLTNDVVYKYYYDCQNRLVDVNNQADNRIASYKYDHTGRRISKTVDSNTVEYVYDGQQIIAEYEDGVLARKFVYGSGIDEPICMIDVLDNDSVYYYHSDRLGSIVAMSDSAGNIVEKYDYDMFGTFDIYDSNDNQLSVSSVGNPYYFTGRDFDFETGLYNYRARYYNPVIGRFLQTDPIGYGDSMNLYQYCLNNPFNFVDPYGQNAWEIIIKATEFTESKTWENATNFVAGMGDNLSLGLTNKFRDYSGLNSDIDYHSGVYKAGEWSGVALGTAIGTGGGLKAAGLKGVGKEFSHWIPKRLGGIKSIWNGNYVSTATHALSDPYRYQFMSKTWKAANPLYNVLLCQFYRIPNVYKGFLTGIGYGELSMYINSKNCKD